MRPEDSPRLVGLRPAWAGPNTSTLSLHLLDQQVFEYPYGGPPMVPITSCWPPTATPTALPLRLLLPTATPTPRSFQIWLPSPTPGR